MGWQPPRPRAGRPAPDGPHEGVPFHLREPLEHWLETQYGNMVLRYANTVMLAVATSCRIKLMPGSRDHQLFQDVMGYANQDPENCLDVIHHTIQIREPKYPPDDLERMLVYGGSAWKATVDGLFRRVDPVAQEAFDNATQPQDVASEELQHAWIKAYGRQPDASDAWDHAIKAAETILIPIVVPTQAGAHMGHVLGELDHHGAQWELLLTFNQSKPPVNPPSTPVQALVGLLRLLYPNPDRHVGPHHREPTLEEAQAVVHLAVTIVQWGRDGQILKQ